MKFPIVLYLLLICFMIGCTTPKYTHFSLRKSIWKNKGELLTKGYYFCDLNNVKNLLSKKISPHYYEVMVLFENGSCCVLSNFFTSHEQIKEYLAVHASDLGSKDKYAYWGRYLIEAEQISIEYFFHNPDQQYLGVYRRIGLLCGNNCFLIKKGYMVKDDPDRASNKHYRYEYMPLTAKIDSTNWMMKKSWFKVSKEEK